MRLLIWASSYGQTTGGGPVLAPLLAAALGRRGHDVTVLTDRRPEHLAPTETRDGVRVHRPLFRRALAGDVALIPAIRREVAAIKRERRPDLAFIFSSGYGEFFHHVTEGGRPVPLVVGLHDRFPEACYRADAMVARNLRAAGWVTACSRAVLETARYHLPALIPISSVIHNALPMPDEQAVRPDGAVRRLAYVGRLVRQKGVDVLIAAMKLLGDRFPALNLAIAGDGDERPALEAQAVQLGLGTRIVFVGTLSHDAVYPFLAEADLVVMPSRIESFGLVALEAAQMARPIVASAVDGLPEVIDDGQTGLLVPPDDPAALAQAIAALLDDPQRARALGAAARRRAETLFAWDRYVGSHERLFETMLRR
jgi:glycosyltransferase involved in cell wall biosynthesis